MAKRKAHGKCIAEFEKLTGTDSGQRSLRKALFSDGRILTRLSWKDNGCAPINTGWKQGPKLKPEATPAQWIEAMGRSIGWQKVAPGSRTNWTI